MRADLKYFLCADADPLDAFCPSGPFGIYVQAIVGPEGEEGEESFGFMVCTPEWFAEDKLHSSDSIASGRHVLFVREFNYPALEKFVKNYCARCEGKTWAEVAEKMSRLGYWEFEDYSKPPVRP